MKQNFVNPFYIVLFFLINTCLAFAQTEGADLNLPEKKEKKYNLTFRLDYSIKELDFNNNFSYEGEYFKSVSEGHIWQTYDTILIDNDSEVTFMEYGRNSVNNTNFKFDLMISVIEPLNIGLSYHLQNKRVDQRQGEPNEFYYRTRFYTFFALAAVVDYKIPIKPIKRLYLNPSFSFGAYQAYQDADWFTGVGKEWYADIKMAILYNIGDHFGIRVYADYSNWLYREKGASDPFPDRNQVVKGNVSSINFGAGLSYRFFLVPD